MCPTFVSSGYNLGKKTQDAFLISAVVKLYLYNQKFKYSMNSNLFTLYYFVLTFAVHQFYAHRTTTSSDLCWLYYICVAQCLVHL